ENLMTIRASLLEPQDRLARGRRVGGFALERLGRLDGRRELAREDGTAAGRGSLELDERLADEERLVRGVALEGFALLEAREAVVELEHRREERPGRRAFGQARHGRDLARARRD